MANFNQGSNQYIGEYNIATYTKIDFYRASFSILADAVQYPALVRDYDNNTIYGNNMYQILYEMGAYNIPSHPHERAYIITSTPFLNGNYVAMIMKSAADTFLQQNESVSYSSSEEAERLINIVYGFNIVIGICDNADGLNFRSINGRKVNSDSIISGNYSDFSFGFFYKNHNNDNNIYLGINLYGGNPNNRIYLSFDTFYSGNYPSNAEPYSFDTSVLITNEGTLLLSESNPSDTSSGQGTFDTSSDDIDLP